MEIGTIIEYNGHIGPIKFVNEWAITFTVADSPNTLREVNMVIYNHCFNQIIVHD